MKNIAWGFLLLGLTTAPLSGPLEDAVAPAPVVVPLRVLDGDRFVDDLGIGDIELFEGDARREIEGLYFVRQAGIERREGPREFGPRVNRTFYLLFQMTDYNPKLSAAVDFLFNEALLPGDSLVIQTPLKAYSLSPQAFALKTKKELAAEMNGLIKKDIKTGNAEFNSLLNDLKRLVRNIAGISPMAGIDSDYTTSQAGLEYMLSRYKETAQKIESQRLMDERKILGFGRQLKGVAGRKVVFFIYQREFRPEMQPMVLNTLLTNAQDQPTVMSDLQDLFHLYSRDVSLNTERITNTFADAGITLHFIFMNKEPENVSGIVMREQSEDVFKAFTLVARATGGVVDSSHNPTAAFKKAADHSEDYYLLYYTGAGKETGGEFRRITVRLKNPRYAVSHRLGYFPD
ncbi:MAG: VWA domain-containing protein [Candidatus Aminicenantes bacterium]|nr:VWA domain-containing protein [Candidatus Aminicenantes bacterium]